MLGRIDLSADRQEIVERLLADVRQWLPAKVPGAIWDGAEKAWRIGDIHGLPPTKQGSCFVHVEGPLRGRVHDFASGEDVSIIDLYAALQRVDLTSIEGFDEIRADLGLPLLAKKPKPRKSGKPTNGDGGPNDGGGKPTEADTQREIAAILKEARAILNTPAGAYLHARGLAVPDTPDLLCADVFVPGENAPRPCMVAIVRDGQGQPTGGIHRTYLAHDGSGKAAMAKPKLALGPIAGGAVRLTAVPADGVLGVAEGVESALAATAIFGTPCWATLGTSGMKAFAVPEGVERVVIFRDAGKPGEDAAQALSERLGRDGIVHAIRTPMNGNDFNDDLQAGRMAADYPGLKWIEPVHEPESPEAVIARLAALSLLDYGQARKEAAKALGVPVAMLDQVVKAKRDAQAGRSAAQGGGTSFVPLTIEPWDDPVNGAALLEEIVTALRRHIVVSDAALTAIALWVLFDHTLEAHRHSPRLHIKSPVPRCGKTTLLHLVESMVPKPVTAENATTAVLFRIIEQHRPTLMLDEVDAFVVRNQEMRGIINSGHIPEGSVLRLAEVEGGYEPRQFSTWCAMVLAGIRALPATIEDRSIPVYMERRRPGDAAIVRVSAAHKAACAELRRKAARWALDHVDALRDADPELPAGLNDRACDNWRPLLSIAERVGGSWPWRAHSAAIMLAEADAASAAAGLPLELLTDLRTVAYEVFGEPPRDDVGGLIPHDRDKLRPRYVLATDTLTAALARMTDRPWAIYKRTGNPITGYAVSELLKDFRIAPDLHRPPKRQGAGLTPVRGYRLGPLEAAFERYLPPFGANPEKDEED